MICRSYGARSRALKLTTRRDLTSRLGIAITLLFTLLTDHASAEPSVIERENARTLMDQGDELRTAGNLWGALERFRAADAIMHVPTTGLELARVQAQLLQLIEARSTALAVTKLEPAADEPKVYTEARKAAEVLADELITHIPDVAVRVEPAVANMRVAIDGISLPQTQHPLPYKLNPGSHTLVVEAPGYEQHSEQFSLADSQHAELGVVLSKSKIHVPVDLKTAPIDDGSAGRTRGYIGLIAGGVILAGGVTAGIISANKTSSIRKRCGGYACSAEERSDLESAYRWANIANVGIPVGVIGIGYGVFELLTHRTHERKPRASAGLQWDLDLAQPGALVRGVW